MSETPPPLQKVVSAPIVGSNTCDDGAGLRLIDVSSLASPIRTHEINDVGKLMEYLSRFICSREAS